MNNGFFKKITESFREFGKKDAAICVAIAIVIMILAVNIYINNDDSKSTYNAVTPTVTPPDSTSSDVELRLERILTQIDGAGKTDVMITYQSSLVSAEQEAMLPLGAVIIAEGADNLEVRIKIQQAVQTALGIEARQVKIFKMNS